MGRSPIGLRPDMKTHAMPMIAYLNIRRQFESSACSFGENSIAPHRGSMPICATCKLNYFEAANDDGIHEIGIKTWGRYALLEVDDRVTDQTVRGAYYGTTSKTVHKDTIETMS